MSVEKRAPGVNKEYIFCGYCKQCSQNKKDHFEQYDVKSLIGKGINPIFDVLCHLDVVGTKIDLF